MTRTLWLAFRLALCALALALVFVDGPGAVLLPGRFLLDLLGAAGPQAGRYAVFLSGIFYGSAALVSSVMRGQLLEVEESLDGGV